MRHRARIPGVKIARRRGLLSRHMDVVTSIARRAYHALPHLMNGSVALPQKAIVQQRATLQNKVQSVKAVVHVVMDKLQTLNGRGLLVRDLNHAMLMDAYAMSSNGLLGASALSSRDRYALITGRQHHIYAALEQALDTSQSPAVQHFWSSPATGFAKKLRRAEALTKDYQAVAASSPESPHTTEL